MAGSYLMIALHPLGAARGVRARPCARCSPTATPFGVDDFATHWLPLDQAPLAYEMFQKKQDGCVKVLLQP